MKFYQVIYANDSEYAKYGVAYCQKDTNIFLIPENGKPVIGWKEIIFHLRNGFYPDFLSNDLGARLVSERFKYIIERNMLETDHVQWLKSTVENERGHVEPYYILHFPRNIPIVNKKYSLIMNDMIVKVVLDKKEVEKYSIFSFPDCSGRTFFLSEKIKYEIVKSKLTGVDFHLTSSK